MTPLAAASALLLSLPLLASAQSPGATDRATAAAPGSIERPGLDRLNLDDGLAIDGYDPVSYFPEGGGEPLEGKARWQVEHRGVTYRFASEANRRAFLLRPHRYEPAYGGWCAWAMADDDRVEVDEESFLIQDGELLLFYDGFWADTRKSWRKGDGDALKVRADTHWTRYAPQPQRDLDRWNHARGLALGGHDPVALAQAGDEPVAGKPTLTVGYRGLTYRFASEANRAAFRADPSRHEPAVGGWDPVSLAKGRRAAGEAAFSLLHEGRLVLFADAAARDAFAAAPAVTLEAARRAFEPRLVPRSERAEQPERPTSRPTR